MAYNLVTRIICKYHHLALLSFFVVFFPFRLQAQRVLKLLIDPRHLRQFLLFCFFFVSTFTYLLKTVKKVAVASSLCYFFSFTLRVPCLFRDISCRFHAIYHAAILQPPSWKRSDVIHQVRERVKKSLPSVTPIRKRHSATQ